MTRRDRGTRRPSCSLLVVAALASTLAGACSGPVGNPAPARSDAQVPVEQAWFAARADAQRQGTENLVTFYDPQVVMDHRVLGATITEGREDALRLLERQWSRNSLVRTLSGPAFVSTDGAATHEELDIASRRTRQVLFRTTFGAQGATSETVAMSEIGWRTDDPADRRMIAVDALADSYAAAWGAADPTAVTPIYADDATITDSLLQVDTGGPSDLAASDPDAGGLAGMVLATLPHFGGPAVFAAGSTLNDQPVDEIALLLTTPEGAACPEQVAVWLELDASGLIASESRYRRRGELAACHPAVVQPAGWWATLVVPDPLEVVLTGSLPVGDSTIEVYNGSGPLEALLEWGFGRIAAAGLAAPSVERVTFYSGHVDRCEGITGLIQQDAITLCFNTAVACADDACTSWRPWTRATVLHELGHAWMAGTLTEDQIARFLDRARMRVWADSDAAWADRGVELAAETFAWALMDEPYQINRRLAPRTCAELADLFEILTGDRPDPMPTCEDPP